MRKVIWFQEFGSLIVQFYDIDILHVRNNNSITRKQSLCCANIFFLVYIHWDLDYLRYLISGKLILQMTGNDKKLSGGSIYEKLVANSSSANTTAQNSFKHWAWALVVDELSKKMAGMYIVK